MRERAAWNWGRLFCQESCWTPRHVPAGCAVVGGQVEGRGVGRIDARRRRGRVREGAEDARLAARDCILLNGILPEGSVADTTFTEFDGLRLRRSLRDQMKGYKYTFDILALKSQNK